MSDTKVLLHHIDNLEKEVDEWKKTVQLRSEFILRLVNRIRGMEPIPDSYPPTIYKEILVSDMDKLIDEYNHLLNPIVKTKRKV
jgi:hypothetical protein